MHLRPGLRPGPAGGGELTESPRPSSWILVRESVRGMERARKGKGTEGEAKGEGEGMEIIREGEVCITGFRWDRRSSATEVF